MDGTVGRPQPPCTERRDNTRGPGGRQGWDPTQSFASLGLSSLGCHFGQYETALMIRWEGWMT